MEIKQTNKPFGGISIIAVGDLFQLKPVMDSYIFQTPKSDYMPLAINLWEEHFKMTELNVIMRQRENKNFAEILNRLREGVHTEEDIQQLIKHNIQQTTDQYPYHIPHIFITNEKVNTFNTDVFHKTNTSKSIVEAKDKVISSHSPQIREKILNSFKLK